MSDQKESPESQFTVRPTSDSHFSWIRTRLSVERTLLSYVRTATALIGFGFTIVQFFERFKDMKDVAAPIFPEAPRYFGLTLVLAGVAVMAVALWQFRSINSYLRSESFSILAVAGDARYRSASTGISLLIMIIGALVFFALLLRLA